MNNYKIALLVIDGQVDFMDLPGSALSVPGACKDMDRVIEFIKRNTGELGNITMTMDSHRTIDIAHPSFWMDAHGNPPPPFTAITYEDIKTGKWTSRFAPSHAYAYIKKLEDQGEFTHVIWPYHCLIGSVGASIYKPLHDAVNVWEAKKGMAVDFVTKGDNPYTEHFGAFRANIEIPQDPRTQFNQTLIANLMKYDLVFLAGEARSHCVANSLRQAVTEVPALAQKLVIMQDCMSDVPGFPAAFYAEVQKIYDDAVAKGARMADSAADVLQLVEDTQAVPA